MEGVEKQLAGIMVTARKAQLLFLVSPELCS
jgi:hypothetical protein